MKLSTIFAAAAALVLATSCGIFGVGNSTQTPSGSGQASGAALRNLYTQYKTDGKIDMTNINNILNLAALSQCIGELKDAGTVDKSDYIKDFATGRAPYALCNARGGSGGGNGGNRFGGMLQFIHCFLAFCVFAREAVAHRMDRHVL